MRSRLTLTRVKGSGIPSTTKQNVNDPCLDTGLTTKGMDAWKFWDFVESKHHFYSMSSVGEGKAVGLQSKTNNKIANATNYRSQITASQLTYQATKLGRNEGLTKQ